MTEQNKVTPVQVPETLDTRIGELTFTKKFSTGYPTDATVHFRRG
jgi:hypothetical protein